MNAGMIEPFVRARVKRIAIFIATLGVSLILQNLILLIFGGANIAYTLPQVESHNIGPFIMTTRDEQIIVAAFVMMGVLYAMLQYTRFGKSLRAVAENRELARVSGIDAHRVVQFTRFLAGLVAGFAGFILAVSVGTLTPSFGFTFLLVTVTAAVAAGGVLFQPRAPCLPGSPVGGSIPGAPASGRVYLAACRGGDEGSRGSEET
jgi:branched-subunit amino acid ABC-type transport system permease component